MDKVTKEILRDYPSIRKKKTKLARRYEKEAQTEARCIQCAHSKLSATYGRLGAQLRMDLEKLRHLKSVKTLCFQYSINIKNGASAMT